jgi:hypothetical protein
VTTVTVQQTCPATATIAPVSEKQASIAAITTSPWQSSVSAITAISKQQSAETTVTSVATSPWQASVAAVSTVCDQESAGPPEARAASDIGEFFNRYDFKIVVHDCNRQVGAPRIDKDTPRMWATCEERLQQT